MDTIMDSGMPPTTGTPYTLADASANTVGVNLRDVPVWLGGKQER